MARIKDLVHEDLASIEECVPNDDDAERAWRVSLCRWKKRSSKRRNAKKEKPPLTRGSHLSVEAKDAEVPLAMASQMIPRYATGDKVRFEGELDEYGDTSRIYGIIKELIPPGDPRNPLENLTRMYLMHQLDGDRTISDTYVAKDSITGEEVRWPKKEKRKNGSDNLSSQHPSRP